MKESEKDRVGRASASHGAQKILVRPRVTLPIRGAHVGQKWPGSCVIVSVVTDREQPWESMLSADPKGQRLEVVG